MVALPVTKNRALAASPRALEQFPWLARGKYTIGEKPFEIAPLKSHGETTLIMTAHPETKVGAVLESGTLTLAEQHGAKTFKQSGNGLHPNPALTLESIRQRAEQTSEVLENILHRSILPHSLRIKE
jgi:hypothetical protein